MFYSAGPISQYSQKLCNIDITKSYLVPHILLGVNSNYITSKDWRIWVLIPVPLACEASALPFELIPFGKLQQRTLVSGKHHLTDARERILLYDYIFLRNLKILKSENRNYFHTLPHGGKRITWPSMNGESGYRSQYLLHAKQALYHLS